MSALGRGEWGTDFPHIRQYFLLKCQTEQLTDTEWIRNFLWKIQLHKSMTRLHFVMPFEIYKKDNVCNILQKLTNSSIIQNNLLMCSDLYRDFVLLKNFQMECMRETSWIETALTWLWKRWYSLWKMLSPGHSKWTHSDLTMSQCPAHVNCDWSCVSVPPPPRSEVCPSAWIIMVIG